MKVYKTEEDKKVKRLYHQRYRTEWEKYPAFCSWLGSSNDGYSAHCRICDTNVLARLASIKQHLVTRKHQNMVKGELCKVEHDPELEASIISPDEKDKPLAKPKTKPKPKQKKKVQPRIKNEPKVERMETEEEDEEEDIASNDSILDDLLRTDQQYQEEEHEYVVENELVDEQPNEDDDVHEVVYEEELIGIKQNDSEIQNDFHDDPMSEDGVLSEFDLFGKSLALQLNNMDLEDALLCQERLQVVLTEFRLKLIKRKKELKRSS
ncbi:DNA ligase 1 [Drosophila subpulchrella]|uniref:DNA ligase 1 n=1 Tax=Drosophila subpulchrella TaxID=1486046 RepID=UPI0018A1B2FC|nr:DNA ligase 1 [Drosophila subpulchrella]